MVDAADDDTGAATAEETLAEFKDSFSCGSRSNLNVKFLAGLSAEQAGDFFADMIAAISELLDHGDAERVIERFIGWQRAAYAPRDDKAARFTYDSGPFTPATTPLAESRVALVTSSGHFVTGDDPEPPRCGRDDPGRGRGTHRRVPACRTDPVHDEVDLALFVPV